MHKTRKHISIHTYTHAPKKCTNTQRDTRLASKSREQLALTLQTVVDLLVDVRQIGGEFQKELDHREDNGAVGCAQLLLQYVLYNNKEQWVSNKAKQTYELLA